MQVGHAAVGYHQTQLPNFPLKAVIGIQTYNLKGGICNPLHNFSPFPKVSIYQHMQPLILKPNMFVSWLQFLMLCSCLLNTPNYLVMVLLLKLHLQFTRICTDT